MVKGLPSVIVIISLFLFAAPRLEGQNTKGTESVVTRYIDPKQQTALFFPMRSHWLQPWRAYQDTPPTTRLRDAVGINLNLNDIAPGQADAVCRHLAKNGFCKVRIEFGWGNMSWDDPRKLSDLDRFQKIIAACKKYGLRPLFLLNAHHGAPGPVRAFTVRLTEPAMKGQRVVKLDLASLSSLIAGRSGLSNLTDYQAAEVLFTRIESDGTAHLSRPLPKGLPSGDVPAATLKYLPFYPSKRADGTIPSEFEETMAGWLAYVEAISTAAKRALGTEGTTKDVGFDLEVWNELTFGSNFLSINNYYDKPIAEGEWAVYEILRRTVAYVKDPVNGIPGVGISDGFNNQWPWGAGSSAPPGLAALGKHPYAGARRFPEGQTPNNQRPVNALGEPEGTELTPNVWKDAFVPRYVSHFPEYYLTAIQTEHVIRDLSPITTKIQNVEHGRNTHPTLPTGGAAPALQLWITETNLDPQGADPGDLAAYTQGGNKPIAPGLTPTDADWMKAKAILRFLTSYTNKGPTRFYFYAAHDKNPLGLGLVSNTFFKAIQENGGQYPADDTALTSPTMLAVRRLVTAFPDSTTIKRPRPLTLNRITEDHGHKQWEGDPATVNQTPNPHPPLYNRDVLAFFPFQASDSKFVVALYVMTRNLAHLYKSDAPASDRTRFDLPEERYRLSIGGLLGKIASLSLYDPLTGKSVPLHILSRTTEQMTVEMPLTDSPRLLTITEGREK